MNHTEFVKLAENEINEIYDYLEEINFSEDFDLINDVLYIYTSKGDYVINQHSPTKQIWLSSPISNAGYFDYYEDSQQWLDKNGETLKNRIFNDLCLS